VQAELTCGITGDSRKRLFSCYRTRETLCYLIVIDRSRLSLGTCWSTTNSAKTTRW